MRRKQWFLLLAFLLLALGTARVAEPPREPPVIAKPDAFKTLDHPDCSHCAVEAKRRQAEPRAQPFASVCGPATRPVSWAG